MKALVILGSLGMLVACQDPSVSTTVRITPDGVKVVPVVRGSAGNVSVAVTP